MAETKRRPLGKIKSLTTWASLAWGVEEQRKVSRPYCTSQGALCCEETPVSCNSYRKGVLWETFFILLELSFSSLLAGRARDCFCFTFVFVPIIIVFRSTEEHCTTQSFLTACRGKRLSSEGDGTPQGPILPSGRQRHMIAACLVGHYRWPRARVQSEFDFQDRWDTR